jgi:hypothetical protein
MMPNLRAYWCESFSNNAACAFNRVTTILIIAMTDKSRNTLPIVVFIRLISISSFLYSRISIDFIIASSVAITLIYLSKASQNCIPNRSSGHEVICDSKLGSLLWLVVLRSAMGCLSRNRSVRAIRSHMHPARLVSKGPPARLDR